LKQFSPIYNLNNYPDMSSAVYNNNLLDKRQNTTIRRVDFPGKDISEYRLGRCVKFETQQGDCYQVYDIFSNTWKTQCNEYPLKTEYSCRQRRIINFKIFMELKVPNSVLHMLQNSELYDCLYKSSILNEVSETVARVLQTQGTITDEDKSKARNEALNRYADLVHACRGNKFGEFFENLRVETYSETTVMRDWHEIEN
jgi:hypothetical protein